MMVSSQMRSKIKILSFQNCVLYGSMGNFKGGDRKPKEESTNSMDEDMPQMRNNKSNTNESTQSFSKGKAEIDMGTNKGTSD